jgi:hypothetical protein
VQKEFEKWRTVVRNRARRRSEGHARCASCCRPRRSASSRAHRAGAGRAPAPAAHARPRAAAQADVAFVSREVTGLSTKHRVLPDTQRFYDALRAAPGLRWLHVHSAGADRPVYLELARAACR